MRSIGVLLLCVLVSTFVAAQEAQQARYFTPSLGFSRVMYRDLATSPLFYSGPAGQLGLGQLWVNDRSELAVELELFGAVVQAQVPPSAFYPVFTSALWLNLKAYGHYLHRLPADETSRFTFAFGGALQSDVNSRFNDALDNASGGVEVLVNLSAVGKVAMDISRREAKTLNLKVTQLKLAPVKRQVDFRLNAGMVNLNYRPGYAYVYDSELIGGETTGLAWLLSEHAWAMNGWRFSTAIGFNRWRSNGHAWRVEYRWDALNAPGRYDAFQMAAHNLRLVFMFNTTPKRA